MTHRVSNHALRVTRACVTGQPLGTVRQCWPAQTRAAAGPEPSPALAALLANVLHGSHSGYADHPLSYQRTGSLNPYVSNWTAPLRDQTVFGVRAASNWLVSLMGQAGVEHAYTRASTQLVELPQGRLVVCQGGGLVWVIGTAGSSLVAVDYRWPGAASVLHGTHLPLPKPALRLVAKTALRSHATDRLLAALLRRLRLTENYLVEHSFFEIDGTLGLCLGGDPDNEPASTGYGHPHASFVERTRVSLADLLGITTGRQLIRECFDGRALGTPRTRILTSAHDELTVVLDEQTDGRLAIAWEADR